MVYLERAENLSFDEERIADAQILRGNVIFRHEEALMYCDSAYFYEGTNSLDAFGHVRFVQGDTLRGFGDKLFYDGNTKLARLRRHVRLIHGRETENPTILTTDSLNYDRAAGVAYYFAGGEVRDSLNTLTSVRGSYRPNTKQAVFSREVVLTNPKFVLTSDTLLYNTDTKVADIVSPTEIIYEEETDIHSSRGWYNTQTERSMLLDRSVVHHIEGKMMTGDTIYYDKRIGFGQVLGQMSMSDSTQHITLTGEYGQMWEEHSRGYATDSALMVDWSDTAHYTYIHADTLFTEEMNYTDSARLDSTYRRARAYYGVRVFRDDMQMVCDSMVYLGSDSTMHLYTHPITWSENQQIAADSITVYIVNGEVEQDRGRIQPEALSVFYREPDQYGQGDLQHALTIYYAKENDGSYVGMNTTESSFIRMYVEDRKMHHMRFTKETTGVLYPMDQIPEGGDRLTQFFWEEEARPTDPEDVFRRTNERVKE